MVNQNELFKVISSSLSLEISISEIWESMVELVETHKFINIYYYINNFITFK